MILNYLYPNGITRSKEVFHTNIEFIIDIEDQQFKAIDSYPNLLSCINQ